MAHTILFCRTFVEVGLIQILSREYLVMAVVGNGVAVYPAYLIANQWQQQFAYHINLSFTSFLLALVLCELFAFGSIIFVIMRTVKVSGSDFDV